MDNNVIQFLPVVYPLLNVEKIVQRIINLKNTLILSVFDKWRLFVMVSHDHI